MWVHSPPPLGGHGWNGTASRHETHHAAATYRGDGKTDAKDARIIADQAQMHTYLQPVRGADQISVGLRLLMSRRTDLIWDRVRAIN